ncbi:hypothetical protein ACFFJN_13005 [Erwinia mallotivora]|uniref:hypothetical protein n=1 Tax=Erwinia mallotivora TaxID=69222 RepID=UPI0035E58C0A
MKRLSEPGKTLVLKAWHGSGQRMRTENISALVHTSQALSTGACQAQPLAADIRMHQ